MEAECGDWERPLPSKRRFTARRVRSAFQKPFQVQLVPELGGVLAGPGVKNYGEQTQDDPGFTRTRRALNQRDRLFFKRRAQRSELRIWFWFEKKESARVRVLTNCAVPRTAEKSGAEKCHITAIAEKTKPNQTCAQRNHMSC